MFVSYTPDCEIESFEWKKGGGFKTIVDVL